MWVLEVGAHIYTPTIMCRGEKRIIPIQFDGTKVESLDDGK